MTHRFEAQASQSFSNLWLLQRFERFAIEFVDDVAWRLRWQKQTEPNRVLGVGNPCFERGRYARQHC